MKNIKKLFFWSIFLIAFTWFTASANWPNGWTITIPAWESQVVSFSNKLSSINFSKSANVSVKTLEWWVWRDVWSSVSNYSPLQWFIITNHQWVDLSVTYKYMANINSATSLIQRQLPSGWNLIGIAQNSYTDTRNFNYTINNGLWNDFNYSYIADFTNSAFQDGSYGDQLAGNFTLKNKGEHWYIFEDRGYAVFNSQPSLLGWSMNPTNQDGNLMWETFICTAFPVLCNDDDDDDGDLCNMFPAFCSPITITRNDGLVDSNIAVGSSGVKVYWINITAWWAPVILENLSFNIHATWAYLNNITAKLYMDGELVESKIIDDDNIPFHNFNKEIWTGWVNLELKIDLNDHYNTWSFWFELWGISPGIQWGWPSSGAIFTLASAQWVLQTSPDFPPSPININFWQVDKEIFAFRVKAKNDDIKLRDLTFEGIGLGWGVFSNFRIVTPGWEQISATQVTSDAVYFTHLNPIDTIGKDTTKTYYLIADVNDIGDSDGMSFWLSLDPQKSNIRSSNGSIFPMTGTPIWTSYIISR